MDSLIFMPDYVKATTGDKNTTSSNISSSQVDETGTNVVDVEEKVEVENVERPVDLYKVTFVHMILISLTFKCLQFDMLAGYIL